jgi:glutamine amidotransferase
MIVVIDYGMGNLGSVANMFKRVGAESVISGNAAIIEKADKLVLPGVGAFDTGMRNLRELGLIPLLNDKVLNQRTPVLGVCLGMQLLTGRSEEGDLPGLGWIEGNTVRFRFDQASQALKVPHMGWNSVNATRGSFLFDGMYDAPRFYFVHSYHVVCNDRDDVLCTSSYGYEFTSAIMRDNILGTQFHPEKSHKFGMKIYENFARY